MGQIGASEFLLKMGHAIVAEMDAFAAPCASFGEHVEVVSPTGKPDFWFSVNALHSTA
jgi:hypothetical protein